MHDGYWPTHLHFTIFRWNSIQNQWAITDPFGWDPWTGPDEAANLAAQQSDPLQECNAEISYNLWIGGMPQRAGEQQAQAAVAPAQDRYVGGWVGDLPEYPLDVPLEPLDRSRLDSVLAWLTYSLTHADLTVFDVLTPDDGLFYAQGIEGGQPKTKAEFLDELTARLPNQAVCDGFYLESTFYSNELVVWTSGWEPAWWMDLLCYSGECGAIDPAYTSSQAGMAFEQTSNGWFLHSLSLGNSASSNSIGQANTTASLIACDDTANYPAEPTLGFGQSAVWEPTAEQWSAFQSCQFASPQPLGCVLGVLEAAGAALGARELPFHTAGQAFLSRFEEQGVVDLGTVVFPGRANANVQTVMLNGQPPVMLADEPGMVLGVGLTSDTVYRSLQLTTSDLFLSPSDYQFERVELRSDGGQRFGLDIT
jgi:hypothetical protein